MYCILVTGIPATGKSTMASALAEALHLPVISKDAIKERMYDEIGFGSRAEKVRLGVASMQILYYMAEQLMQCGQAFILENNFENISKEGLLSILEQHAYTAITVTLTGDYRIIYQRFLARDQSPNWHRGHVVNDCYPETGQSHAAPPISFENFVSSIETRGMDRFTANGPQIVVDTTDFSKIDRNAVIQRILDCCPQ